MAATFAMSQCRISSPSRATPFSQRALARRSISQRLTVNAGAVQELDSVEAFEAFIAQDGLTCIDYYTTWCGPCKMIAPKVEEMAQEITQVKFGKINLTNLEGEREFTKQREIKALPTFHLFQNGEKISQTTGNNPTELRRMIFCVVPT